MKMTTAVKSSMITLALGTFVCLLPTTRRAERYVTRRIRILAPGNQ